MTGPAISTPVALLLALREGPGYGLDLIRRVKRLSQGHVRLTEPRVYSALGELKRRRLVTAATVTPGGRPGARTRTYYDLTLRGIELSTLQLEAIRAFVAPAAPPGLSSRESRRMASRLQRAEELAETGRALREARVSDGR
jgi:DNA-binding PadR family transcriptional regulator